VARAASDPKRDPTLIATPILDWGSPPIRRLAAEVDTSEPIALLRAGHALIAQRVVPVYALDEYQAASRTLELGRGSCSQRFAVLEAVARASGIPTRVRGLSVEGQFWYPRFPRLHVFVPDRVVIAWPSFLLDDSWMSVSHLFEHGGASASFFTNEGESLFEAVGTASIEWERDASSVGPVCDLSSVVGEDLGFFDTRDELFDRHRTFSPLTQALLDPIVRRWRPRSERS